MTEISNVISNAISNAISNVISNAISKSYTFHKISQYSMKIKNIFFCHGGLQGLIVYLGAIKELYKQRDKLDLHKLRIYGSSSGASLGLICLLVLNDIVDVDELIVDTNRFFDRISNRFVFQFTQTCVELLETLWLKISDPRKVVSLANKHLYVGISQQTGFRYIQRFSNVPDITHALLLSSNVVLLARYPAFDNKGVLTIDGGYMMTKHDLPRNCLVIYDEESSLYECNIIPDYEKRGQLISKGECYVKRIISSKQIYRINDKMFNNLSDSFIHFSFYLQKYVAIQDLSFTDRIKNIYNR